VGAHHLIWISRCLKLGELAASQGFRNSRTDNGTHRRERHQKEDRMQGFSPGLFDRLAGHDADARATRRPTRAADMEACKQSITRDLIALLNTRTSMPDLALAPQQDRSASVVNYGLMDFAGLCMTSDTDQQKICTAVRQAIERHEPRLHNIVVLLTPKKGAINRVEFMIAAELKGGMRSESMSINAVFRPSLQQYSIDDAT
jgi:type VI secretion system protein ImpF